MTPEERAAIKDSGLVEGVGATGLGALTFYGSLKGGGKAHRSFRNRTPSVEDRPLVSRLKGNSPVPITEGKGEYFTTRNNNPKIVVGKTSAPETLAHEIGHARVQKSRLGRIIQSPVTRTLGMVQMPLSPLIGAGVGVLTPEGAEGKGALVAAAAPALLAAPMLASEAAASISGIRNMKRLGASPAAIRRAKKSLLGAFGTYGAYTGLGVGGSLTGYGTAKSLQAARALKEGEAPMEKEALSLSNLRVLKGAGAGAAGGAALGAAGGAATAQEGNRGSAALKGALGGAAVGAAGGAAGGWAAPRVQAGMKGGLTLGQSAKAVGQDAVAQTKGLVRPRAAPAAPPAPIRGAANPTQIANAQSRQSYQQLPESAQKVLSSSDLVAKHGVPPEMAAQLAGMSAKPGESMADSVARNVLRGTSPKATTFSPDAGTVAQVRRLPTAARQEMPTAMGKAAFVKMALDTIHGGKADGTKKSFDPAQVAKGLKVEREHTDDPEKMKEIVQDHLTEFPDYYTRLKKMEDEAKGTEKKADDESGGRAPTNKDEEAIKSFLMSHPGLKDENYHEFLKAKGINVPKGEAKAYSVAREALQKTAKGYLLDNVGVEPKVRKFSSVAPKPEFRTKTAMIPSAGQGLNALKKNMQSPTQVLNKSQKIGVPDFKIPEPKPLNKIGFSQSAYSGPLSDGNSTKYTSYIPPFRNPAVKTAGPPSEDNRKDKTAEKKYMGLMLSDPTVHLSEEDAALVRKNVNPLIRTGPGMIPLAGLGALTGGMGGGWPGAAVGALTLPALAGTVSETEWSKGKQKSLAKTLLRSAKAKEKKAMVDEFCKLNNIISSQGQLTKTKKVGAPKASAPPGPSIQQISKPVGFGSPIAGATKGSI